MKVPYFVRISQHHCQMDGEKTKNVKQDLFYTKNSQHFFVSFDLIGGEKYFQTLITNNFLLKIFCNDILMVI